MSKKIKTTKPNSSSLLCIGAISGTSMDAIDVAAMHTDGVQVFARLGTSSFSIDGELKTKVGSILGDATKAREKLIGLEKSCAKAFGAAIEIFIKQKGLDQSAIDLVGCHGQTIFHDPDAGFTRQLCDNQLLSDLLKIEVIAKFRQKDMANGGQGAPLAPLYHRALAKDLMLPVVILNLGGVGNLTYIDQDDQILAFDTGPASAMLDDYVKTNLGLLMDEDGKIAATGIVASDLVREFATDEYFNIPAPKSLDRNHFHKYLKYTNDLGHKDALATLTQYTVTSVEKAFELLPNMPHQCLVTGGGRLNSYMMAMLDRALKTKVEKIEVINADGDALEAEAFAFLAARSHAKLPLSVPTTTGVSKPCTGGKSYIPLNQ